MRLFLLSLTALCACAELAVAEEAVNLGSTLLHEKEAETFARNAKDHNPSWAVPHELSAIDTTKAVLTPTQEGVREKAKTAFHLKARRRS